MVEEKEEKLEKKEDGKKMEKSSVKESKKEDGKKVDKEKTLESKIKEEKKEDGKKPKKEKPRKTEASANGYSLHISTKHSKEIARFISGLSPEKALEKLEMARKMKIAVPFRGEIPHRKGKIMSGRYPITALGEIIKIMKSLIANASLHGVDLQKSRVHAYANKASRPYRRFGNQRFKRTHMTINVKEK